jgi:hypothetical protein
MTLTSVSNRDREQYERDGYLIVRELFPSRHIELLSEQIQHDEQRDGAKSSLDDAQGGRARFSLWYDLRDDLYRRFICSERLVEHIEQLLGERCYHYHSKIIFKEPNGGAWLWHQDYGYWYYYGFLCPRLASCSVAVDPATSENGCMRVLAGSHRMGRLEHVQLGEQLSADEQRVAAASAAFESHDLILAPGDAAFFHCNLVHGSPPNHSLQPRRSLIVSYNAYSNQPFHGYEAGRPMFQGKQPSSLVSEKLSTAEIESFAAKRGIAAGAQALASDQG